MLPVVSVVTIEPSLNFRPSSWDSVAGLEAAYASLSRLEVEWEWIIAGRTVVSPAWATDARVKVVESVERTAAFNAALVRCRGLYVVDLDGASELLSGINELVTALKRESTAAYAFGRTVDWEYEQGAEVRVPMTCPYGAVPVGDVLRYWDRHHAWWFVPQSALWRREHLVAVGGHSALPALGHAAPLIVSSASAPAVAVDAEVYRMTRFHAAPDRGGVTANEATRVQQFLHDQLDYGRRLGYRVH